MTFAPLQNDTFLRACLGQATDHTPVWLMRQAGRYLPEYCATRAKAGSFMGLATNVDYATEVTLQPLARYPLDAAILFSDILTVPDAMGLGLSFQQGEGPKFERTVRDEAAVAQLAVPDMDKLRYVFDAVASIRKALNGRVPLIGFSGSPWTLACYMVEGSGSSDYRHVKTLMYARPDLMHRLLAVNADSVAAYLNAQIDAGAQAVMLFDSWGGVLADGAFQHFSLAYTARVLAQLKRTGADGQVVPRIVFTKGGGLWLSEMRQLACDALGLDWTMDLARARQALADASDAHISIAESVDSKMAKATFYPETPVPTALQGNIDPHVLFAPPEAIRAEARRVLDRFGAPHRDPAARGVTHIFNLGHGISQFTPPEHVAHLVDEVHQHSRRLRAGA
ncbi:uroporphyrinogen decarboxylase [Ottowia sp.]|jgi:uroporphyrinogen decarboxylase|uniref:uroporphyrinogen decarboxylase n=1 Tax=Ottowia sp. TaxID=1898956 RepID=UPI0025FB496A|nr:uroporphyrinogen decarboxylase [Ottowia sp.]MBK6615348.1 uroporphyrinogen decarboxylase [Ottowia sp.]